MIDLTPTRLRNLLDSLPALRVGVIGDFFLDAYFDCDPSLDEVSLETGKTCYQVVRQRRQAGAELIRQWTGQTPAQCRTMAEICARPDVDVLVIATADFQHAPLTRQATWSETWVCWPRCAGTCSQEVHMPTSRPG